MVAGEGGVCGGRGACMVVGGYAWWQGGMCGGRGACMVVGGIHGGQGACVVVVGMHGGREGMCGGGGACMTERHAWWQGGMWDMMRYCQ